MKKKSIVFSLSLFFLIFLSTNVSALSGCAYQWKDEWGDQNIFLTSENSSTKFDKILAIWSDKDFKFAKENTIPIHGHGTCPWIAFDKDKKIYSSRDKCLEAHGRTTDKCSWDTSGQWVTSSGNSSEDDNDSSEGHQAVLTSKTSTQCVYQGNARLPLVGQSLVTLNVSSNNGSGYKPEFTCDYDGHKSCTLETNAAYFYGANESTGTSFLCPKYIYFKAEKPLSEARIRITITGSGDNGDTNHSGVESNVEGDKRKPSEDTSISISDGTVDCSIFENGFGQFLMEAYKLIKFAVPILIIAFAIVDFVKAMASQDEAEVKKSANKLVKRLVIGVLIFVLPTIIEYVLSLAGIDYGTCGIK